MSYLYAACRPEYTAHCGAYSPHSLNGRACFWSKARGLAARNRLSRTCVASLRAIMARYGAQ